MIVLVNNCRLQLKRFVLSSFQQHVALLPPQATAAATPAMELLDSLTPSATPATIIRNLFAEGDVAALPVVVNPERVPVGPSSFDNFMRTGNSNVMYPERVGPSSFNNAMRTGDSIAMWQSLASVEALDL